jgi:hypothetical protein
VEQTAEVLARFDGADEEDKAFRQIVTCGDLSARRLRGERFEAWIRRLVDHAHLVCRRAGLSNQVAAGVFAGYDDVVGAHHCLVDLPVVGGACGRQKMRVVEKGEIVDRDHRAVGRIEPRRTMQRRDEVGEMEHIEGMEIEFSGEHELFQAMMRGRKQRATLKVRLGDQGRPLIAVLENDKLVVFVEFGHCL